MAVDQLNLGNVASLAAAAAPKEGRKGASVADAVNSSKERTNSFLAAQQAAEEAKSDSQPKEEPTAPKVDSKIQNLDGRRLSILHDEGANRYVYQSINRETHQVERQYPSEDDLARWARGREIAGEVFDQQA